MDDILIVEDLVKHYPIRKGVVPHTVGYLKAVDGISFSIRRGKTLGLVGESGCGKTTAGRTILRLIEPTSGRVVFDGRDVFTLSPGELRRLRPEMQIIFQDPYASLNPRITIGSAIAEPIRVHGTSTAKGSRAASIRERVEELLQLVGLSGEHAGRYPHEFSGGQRQRIGIARALAVNPKLIVCDEAVSALDVSVQAQILNLLMELQQKFELTYLFIAHDLSVVRHISDRIAVMYLGKIVEEAESEQIFSRPLHPYTRALLEAVPIPSPQSKKARTALRTDQSTVERSSGCRFFERCTLAIDDCRNEEPELIEAEPGHRAACIRWAG
jgi:oligopeptide/dipeptide ABC transporter ATP-binding protein